MGVRILWNASRMNTSAQPSLWQAKVPKRLAATRHIYLEFPRSDKDGLRHFSSVRIPLPFNVLSQFIFADCTSLCYVERLQLRSLRVLKQVRVQWRSRISDFQRPSTAYETRLFL